jgi:hypothetical protein
VTDFIHTTPTPILVLLVIAFCYPVLGRLLLDYVQPKRLRIVELGESLIRDSRLTQKQRGFVAFSLDINGKAWPLLLIVVFLPIVIVKTIFSKSFREGDADDHDLIALAKDTSYQELQDLEVASMFAANPIAGILFGMEIAFLAITGVIFFVGIAGLQKMIIRVLDATDLHGRKKAHAIT